MFLHLCSGGDTQSDFLECSRGANMTISYGQQLVRLDIIWIRGRCLNNTSRMKTFLLPVEFVTCRNADLLKVTQWKIKQSDDKYLTCLSCHSSARSCTPPWSLCVPEWCCRSRWRAWWEERRHCWRHLKGKQSERVDCVQILCKMHTCISSYLTDTGAFVCVRLTEQAEHFSSRGNPPWALG